MERRFSYREDVNTIDTSYSRGQQKEMQSSSISLYAQTLQSAAQGKNEDEQHLIKKKNKGQSVKI